MKLYFFTGTFTKKGWITLLGAYHEPVGDDSNLFDFGDMIDSFTYVVIENGKPKIEKMP